MKYRLPFYYIITIYSKKYIIIITKSIRQL